MNKINTSIIIAVYNAQKRIERVIKALLEQNYDEPYEIILVDDGSTDNSSGIMRKYEKKHKNIKVIAQKNKGAAAARNTGIKSSKGQYIVLTDDDVLLEKDWLKKTIPLLHKKKAGFVVSIIKNIVPENMTFMEQLLFDYAMSSRQANLKNEGYMLMSNAFRRDELFEVGLFDERFNKSGAGADGDLKMRFLKKGYNSTSSLAISTHLEEKKRFHLSFFIKKPYDWSEQIIDLFKKHKFIDFRRKEFQQLIPLAVPIPLLLLITTIVLSIVNRWFLLLFAAGLIGYVFVRLDCIKRLIQRKRNIIDISFLIIIDTIRILSYNLGAIRYFLFKANKK